MKNLKTLLLIAVFILGVGGVANAQKIGHVDYQRVVANMPATRALQTELSKIAKTYKDDIEGLSKKLESTMQKYKAESNQQTEETNIKRAQEVQEEQIKIRQAEQAAYQIIQDKQNSGIRPIIQTVKDEIAALSKAKGLLYVLDASQNGAVLVANGVDLYPELKTKLGLLKDLPQPTAAEQQN